jgi:hypothetical protein
VLAPNTGPRASALRLGACALATMLLASCGGGGGAGGPGASTAQAVSIRNDNTPFAIRTVNNRADLVSGGDALVEVTAPPGTVNSGVLKITRNGADVTSAFAETGKGTVVGLVTGLANGENLIEATVRGGPGAQLVVTNAPRHGPVLSGSTHIKPFYCATPTSRTVDGVVTSTSGLPGEPDADCNIPSDFKLYYRTTATATAACSSTLPDNNPANPCWKPYVAGSTPVDMANTTTDHGLTVPFVVRVERGTMNRGIYDVVVLFDPAKPWTALAPQAQWNGKIYYSFGSSTGQPRRQVRPQASWTGSEEQLKRGFMFVTNSMTDSARNSNRVMMSETVMMMKEHVADSYGRIRYTLGTGCSGGSINSNMNLSISPGLLDGVITTCTYPDSETTTLEVGDCTLLVEAYQKPAMMALWNAMGLTQADINRRKAAINGHVDQTGCHAWFNLFGSNGKAGVYKQRVVADQVTGAIFQQTNERNNCELPNSAVYNPADPVNTAHLPRCNAWSWAENIWGRAGTGPAANDTRDNVGVQYGLKALKEGVIDVEEFVRLNETIGGIDRDSNPQAQRTQADRVALDIAYRSGIVASGRNLAKGAILDLRGWDDSVLPGNLPPAPFPGVVFGIHRNWFSFAVRDRIARDNAGDVSSQALWRFGRHGMVPLPALGQEGFLAMDQWLSNLVTDDSARAIEEKVRAARPASLRDFCVPSSDPAQSTRIFDMAQCDQDPFLKPSLSPRQVAGGPRVEDVLKCELKPLDASEYPGLTFTADQWSRLQAVFPTGVCDWTRPGVGQQAAVSPLTFKAGPGGAPLPPAPVSTKK